MDDIFTHFFTIIFRGILHKHLRCITIIEWANAYRDILIGSLCIVFTGYSSKYNVSTTTLNVQFNSINLDLIENIHTLLFVNVYDYIYIIRYLLIDNGLQINQPPIFSGSRVGFLFMSLIIKGNEVLYTWDTTSSSHLLLVSQRTILNSAISKRSLFQAKPNGSLNFLL